MKRRKELRRRKIGSLSFFIGVRITVDSSLSFLCVMLGEVDNRVSDLKRAGKITIFTVYYLYPILASLFCRTVFIFFAKSLTVV